MDSISLGFVGFGEAGFHIARGLRDAGVEKIFAYDLHRRTPGRGELIEERASTGGVDLVDSSETLAGRSRVLLSVVVADAAAEAAAEIAPYLSERHIYADLNSVSPQTKTTIASIVTRASASFVEGAIMAPVPRHGHRVPILLGGPSAALFIECLSPYGVESEIVSDRVGSAAAVKMCRSIVVKGLEALLTECAVAANRYGASERVFESLGESFPGLDWGKLASYMMARAAVHGERRSQEMLEVSETLRDVGIDPIMASAAARRQKWCADLKLDEIFGGDVPEDYGAIARVIERVVSEAEG